MCRKETHMSKNLVAAHKLQEIYKKITSMHQPKRKSLYLDGILIKKLCKFFRF